MRAYRNPFVAFLILAAATFAYLFAMLNCAEAASADPTPAPKSLYVSYIEPLGPVGSPWKIRLSNGKSDVINPCRYEDGRHCYWVADRMGNGHGKHSFIVTRGHVFKMNLSGL